MDRDIAVALLDQLHAAQNEFYGSGGDALLRDLLASDIAWTVPGNNSIAGVYRGTEAVFDYFRRRRDLAAGTFRMTRRDVLAGEGVGRENGGRIKQHLSTGGVLLQALTAPFIECFEAEQRIIKEYQALAYRHHHRPHGRTQECRASG